MPGQKDNFAKRLARAAIRVIVPLVLLGIVSIAVVQARRPSRTNYQEKLFEGVTYFREARSTPRPLMIHMVKVDLSTPGIDFLVTPGNEASSLELFASTTSEFLSQFNIQVAVNGSFFEPFYSNDYTLNNYYPHSGDPVDVSGLAISSGTIYSEDDVPYPKLCVTNKLVQIARTTCPSDTLQALAGNRVLVEDGQVPQRPPDTYLDQLHPRTALGVDANEMVLWLVVVDGRQSDYSEGVTLDELASILIELGAKTALNLDGGGSSTLVVAGPRGPRILNSPIHTRIPMRERPVANHLGVRALPLTK